MNKASREETTILVQCCQAIDASIEKERYSHIALVVLCDNDFLFHFSDNVRVFFLLFPLPQISECVIKKDFAMIPILLYNPDPVRFGFLSLLVLLLLSTSFRSPLVVHISSSHRHLMRSSSCVLYIDDVCVCLCVSMCVFDKCWLTYTPVNPQVLKLNFPTYNKNRTSAPNCYKYMYNATAAL